MRRGTVDEEAMVDRKARWLVLKKAAREILAPLFPSVKQTQGPILVIEYADTLKEGAFGVTVSPKVHVRDTRTKSISQKDVRLTVPWTWVEYYVDITVPMPASQLPPAPAFGFQNPYVPHVPEEGGQ